MKDERKRIEEAGAKIVFDGYANHRVYAKGQKLPGLNLSRCFGNLEHCECCGISSIPEMQVLSLKSDSALLLCTDGVWEFISPGEAAEIAERHRTQEAMQSVESIAKKAWDSWIMEEGGVVVDDITILLAPLPDRRNPFMLELRKSIGPLSPEQLKETFESLPAEEQRKLQDAMAIVAAGAGEEKKEAAAAEEKKEEKKDAAPASADEKEKMKEAVEVLDSSLKKVDASELAKEVEKLSPEEVEKVKAATPRS